VLSARAGIGGGGSQVGFSPPCIGAWPIGATLSSFLSSRFIGTGRGGGPFSSPVGGSAPLRPGCAEGVVAPGGGTGQCDQSGGNGEGAQQGW
jgi:hypothetical protein